MRVLYTILFAILTNNSLFPIDCHKENSNLAKNFRSNGPLSIERKDNSLAGTGKVFWLNGTEGAITCVEVTPLFVIVSAKSTQTLLGADNPSRAFNGYKVERMPDGLTATVTAPAPNGHKLILSMQETVKPKPEAAGVNSIVYILRNSSPITVFSDGSVQLGRGVNAATFNPGMLRNTVVKDSNGIKVHERLNGMFRVTYTDGTMEDLSSAG